MFCDGHRDKSGLEVRLVWIWPVVVVQVEAKHVVMSWYDQQLSLLLIIKILRLHPDGSHSTWSDS